MSYRMPTGPRAARRAGLRAGRGGWDGECYECLQVYEFIQYEVVQCRCGRILVSRARDAYAVIECREHLQIM